MVLGATTTTRQARLASSGGRSTTSRRPQDWRDQKRVDLECRFERRRGLTAADELFERLAWPSGAGGPEGD